MLDRRELKILSCGLDSLDRGGERELKEYSSPGRQFKKRRRTPTAHFSRTFERNTYVFLLDSRYEEAFSPPSAASFEGIDGFVTSQLIAAETSPSVNSCGGRDAMSGHKANSSRAHQGALVGYAI